MTGITEARVNAGAYGLERSAPPRRGGEQSTEPLVAHVVPEYLPRSATFVYTTIRFEDAFRPLVLTRRTANLDEFPLDAEVIALDDQDDGTRSPVRRALRARRYERGLTAHAATHDCAVIHAHFGWSGPRALTAARQLKLPLVTTFYGRDLAEKKPRSSFRHPYSRLFTDGTLFTCEGPAMAANLAAIGCPRDRIRVVKIGIDLSKFAFEPRIRSGPLILMQTARLVEKKGVDTSIRSYAAARARLGASELWVIGDGPLRAELEGLANSLGIMSSVRFLGELSHQEYIRATKDAHICIQPSRTARDGDTEGGAPTVLLEMQALGVAVVTTRHADIPTVVAEPGELPEEHDSEGVAAAIVRAAEASEEEWNSRLARARTFVAREHDARVTARQHEELYREAIEIVGDTRSRR